MGEWFVYILQCNDSTLYTGITTNLDRRIEEHNSVRSVTRYTRSRQPVKLLYQESVLDRRSACKREAEIKQLSRQQKLQLIQSRPFLVAD